LGPWLCDRNTSELPQHGQGRLESELMSAATILLEIMHGQVGFDSDSRRCKLPAAVGQCQSKLRQYQRFCLHRADIDNPLVINLLRASLIPVRSLANSSRKLSKEQSPRNKRAPTGNHCHKISTSRLLLPTSLGFKMNSTTRPTSVHCLTGACEGKTIVPPRAEGDVISSVEQCEKEGVILCTVPK